MKLFLLGKRSSITHWLEDCAAGLRAEGHHVHVGATRDPRLAAGVDALAAPLRAEILARAAQAFSPDLILAIGAYHVPAPILRCVAGLPGRPPLVGWVGDIFTDAARPAAQWFDAIAYTDSGLQALHRRLGLPGEPLYLAHAVNPRQAEEARPRPRRDRMLFVANPTPWRRTLVGALTSPIVVMGPGWSPAETARHELHRRRVRPGELGGLYGGHLAALNIHNEGNVLSGLNQRNFTPCLFSTPVVAEAQPDLAAAFEPGREVVVWRDAEELNEAYGRLRADPAEAAAIGDRGRRRVLADHTYGQRLRSLLQRL